jgi:hypothetical protein
VQWSTLFSPLRLLHVLTFQSSKYFAPGITSCTSAVTTLCCSIGVAPSAAWVSMVSGASSYFLALTANNFCWSVTAVSHLSSTGHQVLCGLHGFIPPNLVRFGMVPLSILFLVVVCPIGLCLFGLCLKTSFARVCNFRNPLSFVLFHGVPFGQMDGGCLVCL